MLILRGIKNLLDEPAALAYAKHAGYEGRVLNVSGEAFAGSPQTGAAVAEIRRDPSITSLYGFSGGGYNVRHVLNSLNEAERNRLELVVVIGAPKNPASAYKGPWRLVYRGDPGHMDGPRALLGELVSGA